MTLEAKIEAILFWKAEPLAVGELAAACGVNEGEIQNALTKLEAALARRGVCLIKKNKDVMLGTAPETSDLIERLTREELSRDLGRAGLETVSVVLYHGPV